MSDVQQIKNEWGLRERLSSATGLVFGLLQIFELFLRSASEIVPSGNSPSEIASYFSRYLEPMTIYFWIVFIAIPFQIWFFTTLYVYFRRIEKNSIWPLAGIVSAIVGIAIGLFANLSFGALALIEDTVSDPVMLKVLWAFQRLGGYVSGLLASIILAGFGLEMIRIKSGWRIIGIASLAAAVFQFVAWLMLIPVKGAMSPLASSILIVFIAWVFIVSARLVFGPGIKVQS
jgi:hypothetical protein